MVISKNKQASVESLQILVVGNNPIELSKMVAKLEPAVGQKIVIEIAFDAQSILERLSKFTPSYILIDDNIGREELKRVVTKLTTERKTKNIPITVLKNSNYHEAIATGVMDFMLKENLTSEALYRVMRNSLKFRQTQLYLYQAYKRRKGQLARLFQKEQPAFQI
jgi:CheY-like chemotaxis protein